jgi:hypothetical protein
LTVRISAALYELLAVAAPRPHLQRAVEKSQAAMTAAWPAPVSALRAFIRPLDVT